MNPTLPIWVWAIVASAGVVACMVGLALKQGDRAALKHTGVNGWARLLSNMLLASGTSRLGGFLGLLLLVAPAFLPAHFHAAHRDGVRNFTYVVAYGGIGALVAGEVMDLYFRQRIRRGVDEPGGGDERHK